MKWLLSIDIMGGTSAPENMPVYEETFTIERWHILLIAGILIGILLLPKLIKYIRRIFYHAR